jgi:hypothetical protein
MDLIKFEQEGIITVNRTQTARKRTIRIHCTQNHFHLAEDNKVKGLILGPSANFFFVVPLYCSVDGVWPDVGSLVLDHRRRTFVGYLDNSST